MRILFCGARTAGYDCLKYLLDQHAQVVGVVTIDDTTGPRWAKSVLELARSAKLITFTQQNNKDPAFIESIRQLKPTVLFSVYYDKLIPADILNLCEWNINIHGGKLPEYRGSFSNIWAIFNEEKASAATAHLMEATLDSGAILGVKPVAITDDDTSKALYFKISNSATALFKDIYQQLTIGKVQRTPQPDGGKSYRRQLPNEGMINWSWPAHKIHNFIRALNFPPFQPARTVLGDKEAYVYESRLEGDAIILTDVQFTKKGTEQ